MTRVLAFEGQILILRNKTKKIISFMLQFVSDTSLVNGQE